MSGARRATAYGLVVFSIWAVACAGCLQPEPVLEPVELKPMTRSFERDVPVPVGFEFIERSSEDASTGARRLYLRHVYAGRANKISVRDFYREQMPLARWVRRSDGNVEGEYTLRFEKGTESCTVMIRDRERVRGGVEIVVIIRQEDVEAPPVRRQR